MYGYHGQRSLDFLRVTMAMPRLIAPAKRLLEQGLKFGPFPIQNYQSYEANIDFEIRCVLKKKQEKTKQKPGKMLRLRLIRFVFYQCFFTVNFFFVILVFLIIYKFNLLVFLCVSKS